MVDNDPLTDRGGGGGGGGVGLCAVSVSCSICLEDVVYNDERSRARLQCGHEFHLDCIGSAFNTKGIMQCPNCRKVEKGQWLFSSGSRTLPELSMDDWGHDEDLYDLGYSEMPFGVHWCPFSGLTRVPSSFDDGEPPSPAAFHELLGHQTIFAEHTPAPSANTHSCPYVAYFQPLQPSSSNSSESTSYGDISASHTFTAVDLHYHSWDHHSATFSSGNDQRAVPSAMIRSRGDSDRSYVQPFHPGHGSASRSGTAVMSSSMVPPYPSNSRVQDRVQSPHGYHQHQQVYPTARRSSWGVAPGSSIQSSNESTNGFFFMPPSASSSRNLPEPENSMRNRYYTWERDRLTPFPLVPVDNEASILWQPVGASDNGRGWYRHGSERMQLPQSRPESSSASSSSRTIGFM